MVGAELLTRNELETIVVQIESAINNRPQTYISGDMRDFDALTPSHLIYGYRLDEFPTILDEDILLDPSYGT